MLKLNCSYSHKKPATEDYSSQQYHAGLEVELSDGLTPTEINGKVHETFTRLKDAVDAEMKGETASNVTPVTGNTGKKANSKGDRKISNAQAKYLLDLARQNSVTMSELDVMISTQYGVPGIYDMSGFDASKLIEAMKTRQVAA